MLDWTLVTRCCVGVRHAVRDHATEAADSGHSHFRRAGNAPGLRLPMARLRHGVGAPVRAGRSGGILPARPLAFLFTPLVVRALRR